MSPSHRRYLCWLFGVCGILALIVTIGLPGAKGIDDLGKWSQAARLAHVVAPAFHAVCIIICAILTGVLGRLWSHDRIALCLTIIIIAMWSFVLIETGVSVYNRT